MIYRLKSQLSIFKSQLLLPSDQDKYIFNLDESYKTFLGKHKFVIYSNDPNKLKIKIDNSSTDDAELRIKHFVTDDEPKYKTFNKLLVNNFDYTNNKIFSLEELEERLENINVKTSTYFI